MFGENLEQEQASVAIPVLKVKYFSLSLLSEIRGVTLVLEVGGDIIYFVFFYPVG